MPAQVHLMCTSIIIIHYASLICFYISKHFTFILSKAAFDVIIKYNQAHVFAGLLDIILQSAMDQKTSFSDPLIVPFKGHTLLPCTQPGVRDIKDNHLFWTRSLQIFFCNIFLSWLFEGVRPFGMLIREGRSFILTLQRGLCALLNLW